MKNDRIKEILENDDINTNQNEINNNIINAIDTTISNNKNPKLAEKTSINDSQTEQELVTNINSLSINIKEQLLLKNNSNINLNKIYKKPLFYAISRTWNKKINGLYDYETKTTKNNIWLIQQPINFIRENNTIKLLSNKEYRKYYEKFILENSIIEDNKEHFLFSLKEILKKTDLNSIHYTIVNELPKNLEANEENINLLYNNIWYVISSNGSSELNEEEKADEKDNIKNEDIEKFGNIEIHNSTTSNSKADLINNIISVNKNNFNLLQIDVEKNSNEVNKSCKGLSNITDTSNTSNTKSLNHVGSHKKSTNNIKNMEEPTKNSINKNPSYYLQVYDILRIGRIQYLINEMKYKNTIIKATKDPAINYVFKSSTCDKNFDCRYCLNSSNEEKNPLLSLCKCRGGGMYIHYDCVKHWISIKLCSSSTNEEKIKSYYFKSFNCEICKSPYPLRFTLNGESFNLIEVDKPVNKGYIILESIDFVKINSKYTKSIHVITWEDNNKISIGRSKSCDVVINDLSVSRVHSYLLFEENNIKIIDNMSHFGTQILARSPVLIKERITCIQIGRTYFEMCQINPNNSNYEKFINLYRKKNNINEGECENSYH